MGRQIAFHMLPQDCEEFLDFVHNRDPVFVVARDSDSPKIVQIARPCFFGETLCLWNQALLPRLKREYIAESTQGPYYRVDDSLPVLELIPSRQTDWRGRPALTQGRVWGSFDQPSEPLRKWFEAIVRWMRKNYVRAPADLFGYVAPAAFQWFLKGGVLLPIFEPPVTRDWLDFVKAQRKARESLLT